MSSRLTRIVTCGVVGLALAACGSNSDGAAAPVPTVTLPAGTVTATVTATRTEKQTQTETASAEAPGTIMITTSVEKTTTVTTTAKPPTTSASSALSTSPKRAPASTTAPRTATAAAIKPTAYSGTGDDVVEVDVSDARILTFACQKCSGNTVLKADGEDGLLVNEIGSYSGRHLVNVAGDLTQFQVSADAPWTIKLEPTTVLASNINRKSGHGDDVVYYDNSTKATITHTGEANFVVTEYSPSEGRDLLVNEIGNYRGTVPLHTPCIVQINADGDWTVAPSR